MRKEYIAWFSQGKHGESTKPIQELVRCKDCKWYQKTYTWNGNEHMVCVELSGVGRSENDYCSRGERNG